MSCRYCDNAHTNPGLTSDNDLSYFSIGFVERSYTLYFRSGDNRPTAIVFSHFFEGRNYSNDIALYIPKFCPECGRRLFENDFYKQKDT